MRQSSSKVLSTWLNTWWGKEEEGARLFSVVSTERISGKEHKFKYRKLHWGVRNFLQWLVPVTKHWHRLPREAVEFPSLGYPKPSRTWPWATCSSWLCSEQWGWIRQSLASATLWSCLENLALTSVLDHLRSRLQNKHSTSISKFYLWYG